MSEATGASAAPAVGEFIGMLMPGFGEAPGALLAACADSEAPGIPAT
ncbi:hypothetical protein ACWD4N_02805 [Streptomyces sp. NPDC002586]